MNDTSLNENSFIHSLKLDDSKNFQHLIKIVLNEKKRVRNIFFIYKNYDLDSLKNLFLAY